METMIYIAFFVLFVICGYLLYQHVQLERKLKEQDKAQKKALLEAGNAIADTLKVAFDNLKKISNKQEKQHNESRQTLGRIQRLEQQTQQLKYTDKNNQENLSEEIKNERRNAKTS